MSSLDIKTPEHWKVSRNVCLQNERDHDSLIAMVKKKVSIFQNSDEKQYAKLLTLYAFEFLHKQLELKKKVKMTDSSVLSSEGVLLVTEDNCQCKFRCTMWLPCGHIFVVRENLDEPLFCSTLVSEKWKLAYLHDVFGERSPFLWNIHFR